MNQAQQDIISASDKGYRVLPSGEVRSHTGRILKLSPNKRNGYPFFTIRRGGGNGRGNVFAHRLQAFQKFGQRIFAPGIEVRHRNGNSGDFSEPNILIGTCHDNRMDMPRETRSKTAAIAAAHRHL